MSRHKTPSAGGVKSELGVRSEELEERMGGVTTYVVFLRGINLGSTNKIAMPELRTMAEVLGYSDVATYINSGNLIVRTTKQAAAVERELAKAIDVTVRTDAQMGKVLANNPYPDGNPSQVTVAFLMKAPDARAKERVTSMAAEHEPLTFAGREVYVNYSHG